MPWCRALLGLVYKIFGYFNSVIKRYVAAFVRVAPYAYSHRNNSGNFISGSNIHLEGSCFIIYQFIFAGAEIYN